jgi:serine/threonine-protein kinase
VNPERWARLASEFDELCDRPVEAREAGIARLSGEDAALAGELRRMLAADDAESRVLGQGASAMALGDEPPDPAANPSGDVPGAGDRVGPWRLGAPLGTGGMGEVWSGERADGTFEQRVALKLLKRGLETDSLLRRFALERQILARLTHPGIARLIDAGSTPDGRPYFVMEQVEGEPITRWAESHAIDLGGRLRLIVEVAAAVDFAHRNLVVHRDLKPSNVLVGSDGAVKLLDFGIAKLLEGPDGSTHLTEIDGRALTPAYAAPEQIRGEPVTTATDTYALGVILFELLTGALPHRRESAPLAELFARLERETTERPSQVVLAEGPGTPAKRRQLARRLSGDLDNIVLKALAPDPLRRYSTAAALAADLERFLEGRPVSARRDSIGYRTRMFVRRHRLGVAASILVLLTLVGGLAATAWQARRAAANATRAERVKGFLVDVFRQADPVLAQGREISAREVLASGAARIEKELSGEPAVAADLDEALAKIHLSLGDLDRASELAGQAVAVRETRLPADPVARARARALLGEVRVAQTRLVEAIGILEPARNALAEELGPDSLEVAEVEIPFSQALNESDRQRGLEMLEHAVEVRRSRLGEDHLDTVLARLTLANQLDNLGKFKEAEEAYRETIAALERTLGPKDPRLAAALSDLADVLDGLSRAAEAEPMLRRAIDIQREVLGPRHPALAQSLLDFSILCNQMARHKDAQAALEEGLTIWTEPSLDRAIGLRDLGSTMVLQGKYEEGAKLYERSIPLFRQAAGESSPELWRAVAFLGDARTKLGRIEEAEKDLRLAVSNLEINPGPKSYQIRMPLRLLAEVRRRAGDPAEAIEVLRRVRALELELFGTEDHRDVAVTDRRLGIALTDVGSAAALAEARQALDRAVALDRKYRAGAPGLGESLAASARLRQRSGGDLAAARAELEEATSIFAATLGDGDLRRREAAAALAQLAAR